MQFESINQFEQLSSALADEVNGMFFRCANDENWTFLYVTRGIKELVGFLPEEVINNPDRAAARLIHPEDLKRIKDIMSANTTPEVKTSLEYRIKTKTGKYKWVRETNVAIEENGKEKYIEGYIREISFDYHFIHTNMAYNTLEMLAEGKSLNEILVYLINIIKKEFNGSIPSVIKIRENKMYAASENDLPENFNETISGLEIGEGVGSCGTAAFRGERIIHQNLDTHLAWKATWPILKEAGLKSCWSEPIKNSEGVVLGTFGIYWKNLREPTPLDLQKISGVVHLAGIAMEKKGRDEERKSFFSIFDNQPLNEVYLLNPPDGQILYANTGALDNLGYRLEELKLKSIIDLNGKCDANSYKTLVRVLENSKKNKVFFYSEHRTKAGKTYPVEINLQKIFWEGKSVLLANAVDVTEKKEAEQRLTESEKTLAKAEEIASLGSWQYDPGSNRVVGSDNFVKLLHLTPAGRASSSPEELTSVLTEKSKKRFNTILKEVTQGADERRLKLKATIENTTRYFDVVMRKERINKQVKKFFVIGVIRDVTEKVKADKAQNRLSGILNAVFENTDYGIFIKNEYGKYTYVNQAFSKNLGKHPEAIKGLTDFDLYDVQRAEEFVQKDREVMHDSSVMTFESTTVSETGVASNYLITKGPLLINGKVKGVYAILKNVTAEKEAADILEAQNRRLKDINTELGQLVSHTSHDLRSPLASIKGLVSLSEVKYPEDEELQELFNLMKESLEKSDNLINSILELSKGDILSIQTSICNPAEIAQKHIDAIKYMPEAKGIHFLVEQKGEPEVNTDEIRLTAILSNLITNSAKYTFPHEEHKKVEVLVNNNGSELHIQVNDNGIGIPSEKREEIFKIFKRNSAQSGGVGLGLYIVSRIIQALNGEIEVKENNPRGTSMQVKIPLSESAQ